MTTLTLQITILAPPPNILFSLQDKKNIRSSPVLSTGADITFEVPLERDEKGTIQGKFAMGPPAQRFIYICSGSYAGQPGTVYNRRAKIPVTNLPPGPKLAATFAGTAKDGGPFCATVRPLNPGWIPA